MSGVSTFRTSACCVICKRRQHVFGYAASLLLGRTGIQCRLESALTDQTYRLTARYIPNSSYTSFKDKVTARTTLICWLSSTKNHNWNVNWKC